MSLSEGMGESNFEEMSDALAFKGSHAFSEKRKVDQYGRKSIFILSMENDGVQGFGTAFIRIMFKRSLEIGYEGHLHLEATSSSHLFHLYMGMIPFDYEIKGNFDSKQNMNLDMAIDVKKDAFQSQIQKKYFFVKDHFIPSLLRILNKDLSKQPDTNSLGSVDMLLSNEGIARWNTAVTNRNAFVPFKRLEVLHPLMTTEQITELNCIMDKRENTFERKLENR